MPPPRAKRPFAGSAADASQRHITAFFPPTDEASAAPAAAEAPSLRPPPPPPAVQAGLLSVGMRVRKSVPESYKTGAAPKLWADAAAPARRRSRPSPSSSAAAAPPPRELLPFCGINRVGGLLFPPEPAPPAVIHEDGDDGGKGVPALTLSQETVDGDEPLPSRKRSLAADDDDDAAAGPAWAAEPNTPSWTSSNAGGARAKATPRPRARKGGPAEDPGQENVVVEGDFGEADFLVYGGLAAGEMDLSG